MSATIFVWRPHGRKVGHASMALADGSYISWWPESDGDVFDSSAQSLGIRNDKYEEGQKNPDYASAPINDLDEGLMSAWWSEMSGRKPGDFSASRHEPRPAVGRFQLLKGANCSNMVVRALVLGGLITKYPLAATIVMNNPIMTPLTLIDIAEAITGDFSSKVASFARNANPIVATVRTYVQYVSDRK
jgi:hypothetical protein